MKIEQYVMAYEAEQDRIRAMLPAGYRSLRPVLRINAEIRADAEGDIEFNTAVERDGRKGWLNIGHWHSVPFVRQGNRVVFQPDFLTISFSPTGIAGACPAEKDNSGCWFVGPTTVCRPPEVIRSRKEFCDCTFRWQFTDADARGVSTGKTLPAVPTPVQTVYPRCPFTAENAARIPCKQVLGCYMVVFDR